MSIETRPGTSAYTYSSGVRPLAQPAIAWLRGALVLAIAAQLITVSALTSAVVRTQIFPSPSCGGGV